MNSIIIGKKLKSLRNTNHYNVKDIKQFLSEYNMEFSIPTIYKWEEGSVLPNIEILFTLCEIYGCNISYLLEENITENMNLTPCEIFLLEQYRFNAIFRKIATQIYKLYLKEQTIN